MSKHINSFSENMRQVVQNQSNALNMLAAMQASMLSNNTYVSYDYEEEDGSITMYQLPSYAALNNKITAIQNSLENLNAGRGAIALEDGTYRKIKLDSVADSPSRVTNIKSPTTFSLDANWFFENLMYPSAVVSIDLTGRVEDSADRCRIKRIILDSRDSAATALWTNSIANTDYTYGQLISLLSLNNVQYYEDEEDVQFPLINVSGYGEFQISKDPESIDGEIWYTLDTIYYSSVNADGISSAANNILSAGDILSYNETLFKIDEINQNANKVRLELMSGVDLPGINSVLHYYEDPFKEKILKIHFGAHEYNIIYFKAVSENYNLLSTEWSTPVKFFSDSLILDTTADTQFSDYYANNIVDWGSNMIAEAKEKRIAAYNGKIPNAPTLYANDFRVVQINTQINSALDTNEMKEVISDIETVKSEISSLKSTIAAQKTDLQSKTNLSEYNALQTQISTNTTQLESLQTQYSSLTSYLQTLAKDTGAQNIKPKYHVRGFFPIPELKYSDNANQVPQEIIAFDIAYRYIREDQTGTNLNTYTYTSSDGSSTMTGVFSDWNFMQSAIKSRQWDAESGTYKWAIENPADGSEININQIDIAITKGEKLEFKVRSISEAGYPENPLKSEWSNSAIIAFPDTLSTNNEIADLIEDTNSDALNLSIENKLGSTGLTSHIDDTVPNTQSVNGIYFKHLAKNIAFENKNSLDNTVETISAQTIIENLLSRIKALEEAIELVPAGVYNTSTN